MNNFFKLTMTLLMLANMTKAQQISIPRIDQMPDFPQPYEMRNWKQVAEGYDSLVFNKDLSGQYLPLVFFRETNINYPNHKSFGLHTAIGTVNPDAGEAINLIPAVIGASLVGIDKSNQFGQNWALMSEEYFNKRPEENIYLNHPETSTGNDWWYETMPNIFFLQLNSLYPHTGDFDYQVKTLADRFLRATIAMGGSSTPWTVPEMNYRAWNMSTMKPLDVGVKEPEAAGAIAWILYNAFQITGNIEYRVGAEWCLEFLNQYQGNPSYELQLPYGVYVAARSNAETGTNYNIEIMVNWCFNRGELRGWGSIVGKWGDYDCSGLIGEANDEGNDYAFAMNGFEQAGALVPMVRYDDRFATAIAKWVLNLANASRLFYSNFLPDDMQDNEAWSNTYDPNSFIAYESLKETKFSKSPYATGDAIDGGWAATNLMLYSSSHVGIFGGIIDTTNVEGILCLDLLKSDYYGEDAFPTFLYYNPYDISKNVNLSLPAGSFDLYDAVSNSVMSSGSSGEISFNIPAKQSVMMVIIPAGSLLTNSGKKTYVDNTVIDYNNGASDVDFPPRIKALTAQSKLVEANSLTNIYCTAIDPEQQSITYEWTVGETRVEAGELFQFTAPSDTGLYRIKCKVLDPGNQWDTLSTLVRVVDKVKYSPEILKIEANHRKIQPSESIKLFCLARDENEDILSYEWSSVSGSIISDEDSASYTAPATEGIFFIVCTVIDADGLKATDSIEVMVRDIPIIPAGDLIAYYPLNGNANDISGNGLNGTASGVLWVNNRDDVGAQAAWFDGINDNIQVANRDLLNFRNGLSITCRLYIENFTGNEQHPVSHGSWEKRYKISISGNKIRFTLNTTNSVKDLDSETEVLSGKWYHLAVVYDGYYMEIWLDSKLDAFTSQSGLINITDYKLVFGQNLPDQNGYNFNGSLDAVSIFNYALTEENILESFELTSKPDYTLPDYSMQVFPNPVTENVIQFSFQSASTEETIIALYDLSGKELIKSKYKPLSSGATHVSLYAGMLENGIYILSVKAAELTKKEMVLILR